MAEAVGSALLTEDISERCLQFFLFAIKVVICSIPGLVCVLSPGLLVLGAVDLFVAGIFPSLKELNGVTGWSWER